MKRRLIAGAVLLFALSAGSCAATQYLAERFGYASELGTPLMTIGATPIYSPLSWYTWKQHWGRHARKPFDIALSIALGSLLPGFGAALLIRGGDRKPKPVGAYGTARWSTERELEEAEMLPENGLVLCQTAEADIRRIPLRGWRHRRFGRLTRHDGPEHTIVFAPTRSGKGVGVVVPTLLAWTGSAIVYDPKRENWELTAGWRRRFSYCLRFDPTVEQSVRWNPLMEVRRYPYDVRDVQNIAEMLVNPDTTKEQQDHWKLTGHAFLVAAMLHVLYAEPDKSLAGVLKFLTDPHRTLPEQLNAMLRTRHLGDDGPHPAVAGGAREMISRSDNERSGVLSTAISFLSLYRDPIVAKNTSTTDFSLADIMCADRPMTLYLQVPDSDFDRTRPLMRLLLNFFGRRLTEHLDKVDGPGGLRDKQHRLLYLIDEFPSLGRMPFFVSSLAFLAGYRIKCLLIAQSLNQLDQHYGRDNPILDNCHIRLTYGANDAGTAKRIVELIGQASRVKTQISESDRPGVLGGSNVNRSYQEYGRPLLTPDEILSLPFTDAILMVGNLRPYRARKVLFYDDPRFSGRSRLAPPTTPEEQRAELPRRRALPHWLSMPIPDVPPMPVTPAKPKTSAKPAKSTKPKLTGDESEAADGAPADDADYCDMSDMMSHDPAP
jgi:type IV secretion system protein VirD4